MIAAPTPAALLVSTALRRQSHSVFLRTGLAVSAGLITVALLILISTVASYRGATARDGDRTPILGPGDKPTFQHMWIPSFTNSGSVDVLAISPLAPSAPLPPGLTQWPQIGELVPSPALRVNGAPELASEFGVAISRMSISGDGLTDPDERLGYVRLPEAAMAEAEAHESYSSYGHPLRVGESSFGSNLRAKSLSTMLAAQVPFVLMPAVAVTLIAARVGYFERRRQFRLVVSLRVRLMALLRHVVPALAAATVMAELFVGAVLLTGIRVPVANYLISSSDLRAVAGYLLLAPVVASLIVIGVFLSINLFVGARAAINRTDKVSPRAVSGARPRLRRFALVALPGVVVATWWFFEPVAVALGEAGATLFLLLMVIISVALVAPFARSFWWYAGTLLASLGRRRGNASQMLGGTFLASHPNLLGRQALAIGICAVVVVLAFVGATLPGQQERDARQLQHTFGTTMVAAPAVDNPSIRNIYESSGSLLAVVPPSEENAPVTIRGTCRALTAAAMPCTDGAPVPLTDSRIAQLLALWGNTAGTVAVAPDVNAVVEHSTEKEGSYFLLSTGEGNLDLDDLKPRLHALDAAVQLEAMGSSWHAAALDNVHQMRWLPTFGIVTSVAAAAAVLLVSVADYGVLRRPIAILEQSTGSTGLHWSMALVRVFLPFVVNLFIAIAVARILAATLVNDRFGASIPSAPIAVVIGSMLVVGGIVTGLVGGWTGKYALRPLR